LVGTVWDAKRRDRAMVVVSEMTEVYGRRRFWCKTLDTGLHSSISLSVLLKEYVPRNKTVLYALS